jgi:hypothetical protein
MATVLKSGCCVHGQSGNGGLAILIHSIAGVGAGVDKNKAKNVIDVKIYLKWL